MTQPEPKRVELILAMMREMGVSAEELATASASTVSVPTVAGFLSTVESLATPGQTKTYSNHWKRLADTHGKRRLDALRTSDLEAVVLAAKRGAVRRANSRDGRGAAENCVAALRHFFNRAVKDGYLRDSPAKDLDKPTRQESDRRPLRASELAQLWQVCATTGDDPLLDTLLFRFHLETGARRGGALALRLRDLNRQDLTVRLREKGDTERWQPVTATLMAELVALGTKRGAQSPDDAVLRFKPRRGQVIGAPLTYRRYDNLYKRWQSAYEWADRIHVSGHFLRHTAVAEVERLAGFGAARKFAGHRDESAATTLTYIRADDEVVAAVHTLRTGEQHPLAPQMATERSQSPKSSGS